MSLLRAGPHVALTLSVAALLTLALAPFGTRLGWWPYGFGLFRMLPVSGLVAGFAVIIAALTLAWRWSELRVRGLIALSVAIVLSAPLVYIPWQYYCLRSTLPPIHDITTDTDNPPTFSAVLPARAAERAASVAYDDPTLPQMQKRAYPDVAPFWTPMPVAEAFREVLRVATSMPGWTVVGSDPATGSVEASQQSRWFRFTDDIVIRVSQHNAGSRIDMRSTSRQGRHDYGVNATRIRAYMQALRQRIG